MKEKKHDKKHKKSKKHKKHKDSKCVDGVGMGLDRRMVYWTVVYMYVCMSGLVLCVWSGGPRHPWPFDR